MLEKFQVMIEHALSIGANSLLSRSQ